MLDRAKKRPLRGLLTYLASSFLEKDLESSHGTAYRASWNLCLTSFRNLPEYCMKLVFKSWGKNIYIITCILYIYILWMYHPFVSSTHVYHMDIPWSTWFHWVLPTRAVRFADNAAGRAGGFNKASKTGFCISGLVDRNPRNNISGRQ